MLHSLAMKYHNSENETKKTLNNTMKMRSKTYFAEVLVSTRETIKSTFGVPITFDFSGYMIDAKEICVGVTPVDGYDKKKVMNFMMVRGFESSAQESRVFEDNMFWSNGLSAINGLQILKAMKIQVTELVPPMTYSNPNLHEAVVEDINNALNMGWHVIVPESTAGLAGIPYIKYDPNTGSGAYMLGVIAGGTSKYRYINTYLLKLVKYNIDKSPLIKVRKVEFGIYDPEPGKVIIWGDVFYPKIKMSVTYKPLGGDERTVEFFQDEAGNPFQMTIQTGPYIYDETGEPIPWNNPGFYNIMYNGSSIYNFYVWGPVLDYDNSEQYIGISHVSDEDTVGPPITIRYGIKQMEGVTITSSKLQICDQNESVIWEIENIPVGENQEVVWNGKYSNGEILPPGEYGIKIVAVGNGKEVPTKPHKVVVFKVEISTPVTTPMDISNVPAMPNITFNARFQPSTVKLSQVKFKWYLIITFRRDQQTTDDENRIPIAGTTNIIGITEWTPGWGNLITGGDAHVYVTASIDGVGSQYDQNGYQIRGTNPTQAQIFGIANTIEARAVCWQESTHRQFNAIRYTGIALPLPSYAHDGGYGLMMPTPASRQQVWNWRTNLQYGVDYLNTLHQSAQNYLNTWHGAALNTPDPSDDWDWDPSDAAYADRVWNDTFSRYGPHGGQGFLYSPNGNGGVENTTVPIYSYVQRVRGFINNPPW